jgi:hypothetical protein
MTDRDPIEITNLGRYGTAALSWRRAAHFRAYGRQYSEALGRQDVRLRRGRSPLSASTVCMNRIEPIRLAYS